MFDIKTSIHKEKIVSKNEKQKKTRQSVIKGKISRNDVTKEEEQSFSRLHENTTELWCHKTKFMFESFQMLLLFAEDFIHLSLNMISLIGIQCSIQLLYPTTKNNYGSRFLEMKWERKQLSTRILVLSVPKLHFGTKTPRCYQKFALGKMNAMQLCSLKGCTCKVNRRLGNTKTRFAF